MDIMKISIGLCVCLNRVTLLPIVVVVANEIRSTNKPNSGDPANGKIRHDENVIEGEVEDSR